MPISATTTAERDPDQELKETALTTTLPPDQYHLRQPSVQPTARTHSPTHPSTFHAAPRAFVENGAAHDASLVLVVEVQGSF